MAFTSGLESVTRYASRNDGPDGEGSLATVARRPSRRRATAEPAPRRLTDHS
jgi:hypothetical protein